MQLPNMRSLKSILKFVFGIPLTLLSFFFIFQLIFSSWDEVSTRIANVDVPVALLGLFLLIIFFALKSVSWTKILSSIGHDVPFTKSYFLVSYAETKRYIPGNIFAVAARVNSFEKFGISKKMLLATQVVEVLLIVGASAIVSIPGVLFLGDDIHQIPLPFGLSSFFSTWIIPVFFAILITVLAFSLYFIHKNLQQLQKNISYTPLVDAFVIGIVSWVLFGLGNYLVVTSLFPLSPAEVLGISSFFVMTWLVGFLSFFTPMGLGVREVLMTLGLTTAIGGGPAAVAAVVVRMFLIAAELFSLAISIIVKRDHTSKIFSYPWQHFVLGISVVSYIFYFTYVSFLKHAHFLTGKFDLGNMDQTVWNTLHGRVFLMIDTNGTTVMSRLGVHSDFLLVLFAPFYLIWEDARMLLLVQTVVLAAGAAFVYLLANYALKHRTLSLAFSISYLLNFWVQRQNLFDFHAVALATTFLLATFYFLVKKRYVLFSLFLLLSVMTKENVFLVSFFFGGYLFWKGHKKWGIALAIVSIAMFYLLVAYLIPAYRPQGDGHFGIGYFAALGDSPRDVVITSLTHPDIPTLLFFQNGGPFYLFQTLFPTGFLSLLSPFFLLFVSGDYFINVMSENRWLRTIYFHYGALIIPFVYISSIYGVRRLLSWKRARIPAQGVVYYVFFFAFLSTWMYGVLPGARWQSVSVFADPFEARADVSRVLALIPENYSVSASNTLAAHLTHRDRSYVVPKGMDADIVAFLKRPPFLATSYEQHEALVQAFESDFDYSLVYRNGEFYVFSKNRLAPELEALFSSK